MLFSSATFLYGFLPFVLVAYKIAPKRLKNHVLLWASLIFYAFGEPVYTVLLIISSLSDYLHSLFIESRRGTKAAKAALVSSIIVNLGMLGFFKYADFFIHTVNGAFGLSIPLLHVPLPIGISFFTFQTMSYTIDVYRGRVRANRNLATFATFVCLFPQLIAGPIVRYSDIESELIARHESMTGFALGIRRFCVGLAKKVLIANTMGELCLAFRNSPDKSVLFYWIYAVAFSLQIYFDFSGYSDMAIGLGRMFGFNFPENFNYPFVSRTITEFWRRWHMTLGSWFRDYCYIPLGGNRVRLGRWLFNIGVVWMLTGLWHGAEWNFVIWGAYFGVLLALEKLFLQKAVSRAPRAVGHVYVLFAALVGFVIFNGDGFAGAISDLGGMFGLTQLPVVNAETLYFLKSYAVTIFVAVIGSTNLPILLYRRLSDIPRLSRAVTLLEPLGSMAMLLCSTAFLVDGSFNPFLYFRF